MISNDNITKEFNGEEFQSQLYTGVGTIKILAVNPDNATLRKYGWNIAENAEERKYYTEKMVDGEIQSSARVCFLVQLMDLEDAPVISMNFFIRPDVFVNKDGTKCKVVDSYIRTAWGTKSEIKAHEIPMTANGPANISKNYKFCHRGEEELLKYLFKFLNINPFQIFNRELNSFVENKNPGELTIDDWARLCRGDAGEIRGYVERRKDNRMKVCFGVQVRSDNKCYQTFLNTDFFSNNMRLGPDGNYPAVQSRIDKYFQNRSNPDASGTNYIFSAAPIKKWTVTPTEEIKDNSEVKDDFSDIFGDDNDLPM